MSSHEARGIARCDPHRACGHNCPQVGQIWASAAPAGSGSGKIRPLCALALHVSFTLRNPVKGRKGGNFRPSRPKLVLTPTPLNPSRCLKSLFLAPHKAAFRLPTALLSALVPHSRPSRPTTSRQTYAEAKTISPRAAPKLAFCTKWPKTSLALSGTELRAKMAEWVWIGGHFWNLPASPEGKGLALFLWGAESAAF